MWSILAISMHFPFSSLSNLPWEVGKQVGKLRHEALIQVL